MASHATTRSWSLNGLIKRTGNFVYAAGLMVRDTGSMLVAAGYQYGGKAAFIVATTSMLVLMPLLFEIAREGQMLEAERAQVKDLRSRGYSDRQLQEMGYTELAIHSPSVAGLNKPK